MIIFGESIINYIFSLLIQKYIFIMIFLTFFLKIDNLDNSLLSKKWKKRD